MGEEMESQNPNTCTMSQVKALMKAGEEKVADDVAETQAVKQISDPYTSDYTHVHPKPENRNLETSNNTQ